MDEFPSEKDVLLDKDILEKVASMKKVLSQTGPPSARRKTKPIKIPRRKPSIVIPPRKIIYVTPDKTQCRTCTCYPREDSYRQNQKLRQCVYTVATLYELSARALDAVPLPAAFSWDVSAVMCWMCYDVGLPQYEDCMLVNHMNGRRLLMLEDPSHLPLMNITDFEHIKKITAGVRKLYGLDFIRFARSVGLPQRRPMGYCNAFKARTGPNWGVRLNWAYSDVLRWMKILGPTPVKMDHWDLVWHIQPDFPKTLFGRIPPRDKHSKEKIPICTEIESVDDNLVPRKYRLNPDPEIQLIWMEKYPTTEEVIASFLPEKKSPPQFHLRSTVFPPPRELTGLTGNDLMLAKRKQPTPKFLPDIFFARKSKEEGIGGDEGENMAENGNDGVK